MLILCWLFVLNVFTALKLSRIKYAISVWGGHLTSQQRQRIYAFLNRARNFGFTESIYCIADLWEKSDTKLFEHLANPAHCLYPILPGNNKSHEFLLRKRGHTFTLPHSNYNLYKTPFSTIVFLSSYNFLWCCVLYYLPRCTVPVLMHCSCLMSNNKRIIYLFTYQKQN